MDDITRRIEYADEEIVVGGYITVLLPHRWKIAILSLATGVITLFATFFMPKLYEASATIVPAREEDKPNISLGGLAASFGLTVGGPTSLEDLEALFKSRELTVRVFRKYNLWPVISPDDYDPATGKIKVGWLERLKGGKGEAKPPGDWDAIRAVEDRKNVSVSRKLGTLSVSFESRSAEGSRDIVVYYFEEAKSILQEKALVRANRNKKFLEEQIGRTVDPIIRERLYTLYSKEVEREMLARNREQFGFTILDPSMAPDRKSRPRRARSAVAATLFSFPGWCALFLARERNRRKAGRSERPVG
jgi:uncharacterized protein involved in exopolysaccharide biosynthesis